RARPCSTLAIRAKRPSAGPGSQNFPGASRPDIRASAYADARSPHRADRGRLSASPLPISIRAAHGKVQRVSTAGHDLPIADTDMDAASPVIRPVVSAADRKEFIELAYRLNASDPNWIPPLRDEVKGLLTPGKNPWFEHAEAALFLAERDGRTVGRISAQI